MSISRISTFIKNIIEINTKNFSFDYSTETTFFLKFIITSCNVSLILLLLGIVVNLIFYIFFKPYNVILTILKYFSIMLITIVFLIFLLKFYITLKVESVLGVHLLTLKLDFFKQNSHVPYIELYTLFSSSFGDAIIILCLIVGLICLELLGPKNLFNSVNNISIFFLFTIFVVILSSTTNLLIMFIGFEFIFLPTVYFAFSLGYTKKIDNASKMLIY